MSEFFYNTYCPLCGVEIIGDQAREQTEIGEVNFQLCSSTAHTIPHRVTELITQEGLLFRLISISSAELNEIVMCAHAYHCYLCGSELVFSFEYGNYQEHGSASHWKFYTCAAGEHVWALAEENKHLIFTQYQLGHFKMILRRCGVQV